MNSSNKSIICLTLLLVLIASISTVDAICKDKDLQAGPCKINVHVCTGWVFKYSGEAKESVSGKVGTSKGFKSGKGAGSAAVLDLFANKLSGSDCNCGNAAVPVGKCNLQVNGCFMFDSEGDLTANPPQPAYRVTVTNPENGHSASSKGLKDQQEAGKAAVAALFQAYPDDGAACFSAVSESASVTSAMESSTESIDFSAAFNY